MAVIAQDVEGLAPDLDRRLRLFLSGILAVREGEWMARVRLAGGSAFVKVEVKGSGFARTVWIYHEDLAFQPEQVRTFIERVLRADGPAQTE